jgi:hypothetical protein
MNIVGSEWVQLNLLSFLDSMRKEKRDLHVKEERIYSINQLNVLIYVTLLIFIKRD